MTAPPREDGRLLWILRHAKSVPEPPRGGSDHERALSPRGRRDAGDLGRRLGSGGDRLGFGAGDLPAIVLCSTATRTVETASLVSGGPGGPPVLARSSLYGADPEEILGEIRLLDDGVRAAMVVGHNPGVHQLVMELLGGEASAEHGLDRQGFPTCAVAVVALAADGWDRVGADEGRLIGFFRPPYAAT